MTSQMEQKWGLKSGSLDQFYSVLYQKHAGLAVAIIERRLEHANVTELDHAKVMAYLPNVSEASKTFGIDPNTLSTILQLIMKFAPIIFQLLEALFHITPPTPVPVPAP